MNSSNMVSKDRLEFDPVVPEFERRFYQKAYPNVNFVCERKVHCTVCKMHIGTAPSNESIIRMHPILRVTHCKKCHEFYNSGEFSKGEDGSELYCRWCGQGGEVYCCSNCPFVFCKSCIISNLSRGVVADIEQNENWSCFNCAPKMLWPLRAQHWALMRFIDKQKKAIINSSLSDAEIKVQMTKDRSLCCKAKKTTNYASDSSDSSNISLSKLKQKTGEKRSRKSLAKDDLSSTASPSSAKKVKSSNDEVVCTPDVMSMLEPECQLTVSSNTKAASQPVASSPKIMSIPQPSKNTPPPPQPIQIRPAPVPQVRAQTSTPVVKKTIVGPRLPSASSDFTTPVYHTINGYRIDLNSAAQQETVRLPNGKLIQVKRQGAGPQTVTTVQSAPSQPISPARIVHNTLPPTVSPITATVPTQQIVHSSGGHVIRTQLQAPRSITVQNPSIIPQFQQQTPQQYQQITIRQPNQQIATIRYQGAANQQVTNILQNGAVQLLNGATVTAVRPMPTLIKQFFPNTPLGFSRTQLQSQICSALDICQHLMGKVQTLTNSNAYKTAKSLVDVKELYIHLSYLLTYAIGRFKGLQDNCLSDMRELGFTADANSLENGQLAADKQASDAEEDEITIVEPKTDTINLDSDNEDDVPVSRPNNIPQSSMMAKNQNHIVAANHSVISGINNVTACNPSLVIAPVLTPNTTPNELPTEFDYSKITTNFLAGMLEVDLNECTNSAQVPKKPRKKTTNKPNPTLIKQKEMQERERLENMKKNDAKLKMQVQIALNKVEDIYEFAKPMIDGFKVNDEEKEEKVKEATNSPLLEKADEKETIKEIDELLVPLDEKTEQDEKVEVIEKDEQPQTVDEKDPEKSPDESKSSEEDKDDPDDVVVVFVEDFENSKDAEPKNDGEDSDSVDMSEQVEIRETDLNPAQQEESLDSPEKEEKIEDEAAVESPKLQENEDEAEVLKSDEDDEDLSLREDLEAEVMMALKETAAENDAALKEAPKPMDVETDPLQDDDDKNLLVPMESQENMDTGLDDNLSTHSINFEGILGQTEVA